MDVYQVAQDVNPEPTSVTYVKTSVVGSFNTLSDTGSERILANEGHNAGSWALMLMVKSVPVVSSDDRSEGRVEICNFNQLNAKAMDLVKDVADGFANGVSPERTEEGLGGTYFVSNSEKRKVAIFKPCDEEPFAPCNPKGFVGRLLGDPGLKPTVRVGEAALREVAAYLLDRNCFAKVPTTLLIRANHPAFNYEHEADCCSSTLAGGDSSQLPMKLGSIQEFVSHLCDTTEMGTSRFTVSDVQRIAILDIRLYNADRHAGNILVRKVDASQSVESFKETGYELIPIDHGFCLPEALEPPYFEWQHWSQARMPLGPEELEYINSIDIEAEKNLLRKELPVLREESLRTMEVATTLLKKCAAAGLSLNEIAGIMTQPLVSMDEEASDLLKMCRETKEAVLYHSVAGLGITCITATTTATTTLTTTDEESDYQESPQIMPATPTYIDELQFCFDDFAEPARISSGNTPSAQAAATETVVAFFQQGLVELERLSLEGECTQSTESEVINLTLRNWHRSLSMALPASSICCRAPKRGFNGQRTRRTHRPSAESPHETDQKVTYPPLVHGSAPGTSDDLFRHMTPEQWSCFMELLSVKIDDGIKEGKWICHDALSRSVSVNLGISCPRF